MCLAGELEQKDEARLLQHVYIPNEYKNKFYNLTKNHNN